MLSTTTEDLLGEHNIHCKKDFCVVFLHYPIKVYDFKLINCENNHSPGEEMLICRISHSRSSYPF